MQIWKKYKRLAFYKWQPLEIWLTKKKNEGEKNWVEEILTKKELLILLSANIGELKIQLVGMS